jgi:hypothetical protein
MGGGEISKRRLIFDLEGEGVGAERADDRLAFGGFVAGGNNEERDFNADGLQERHGVIGDLEKDELFDRVEEGRGSESGVFAWKKRKRSSYWVLSPAATTRRGTSMGMDCRRDMWGSATLKKMNSLTRWRRGGEVSRGCLRGKSASGRFFLLGFVGTKAMGLIVGVSNHMSGVNKRICNRRSQN